MNKTYERMINNFLEQHKQPTAEDLYNFIIDNEWRIFNEYDKFCRKEDLLIMLEQREYNVGKLPTDLVDSILERYEDRLNDSEEWHYILNDIIDDYKEDLEEYKDNSAAFEVNGGL